MFVELLKDHITVNDRTHTLGSVVETDERRGKALINREHAKAHAGPAFEAEPEEPAVPPARLRQRVTEKATKLK